MTETSVSLDQHKLGLDIEFFRNVSSCPLGIEPWSVGFWLNAWLARPRRMTSKPDLMFTPISVRIDCSVTDQNESHVHVSVHMGIVKRERPWYKITCRPGRVRGLEEGLEG